MTCKRYVWEVLQAELTENTWRAAINEEGMVASVHMVKDENSGKVTCQQVLSTIHTGNVS